MIPITRHIDMVNPDVLRPLHANTIAANDLGNLKITNDDVCLIVDAQADAAQICIDSEVGPEQSNQRLREPGRPRMEVLLPMLTLPVPVIVPLTTTTYIHVSREKGGRPNRRECRRTFFAVPDTALESAESVVTVVTVPPPPPVVPPLRVQ